MGILDDTNIGISKPRRNVRPITGTERKTTPRVNGVVEKRRQPPTPRQPTRRPIDDETPIEYRDLLELMYDAVAKFNEDLARADSGFQVRVWDSGAGFHIQIVRDTDETVIHQTQLLLATDVDVNNIDKLIDEFIREKGIFIDIEK
jgi:hypothetical protein